MTQQEIELKDFAELKQQFALLDMKLERQRIISEEIVSEVIKEKLSHIEKWYGNRFKVSLVSAPVVSIIFFIIYWDRGFEYWGFSLFTMAVGILEYLLNRRCYDALDVKKLPFMSMTEAQECIIKHKRLRSFADKLLVVPYIALIAWTILVASGFSWHIEVVAITLFAMGLSVIWGYSQQKANKRSLDAILQYIKSLKGEI